MQDQQIQRTAIYVDGFNLYYGALKRRPNCRWLNIKALCQRMLDAHNSIISITYCSARVRPRRDNPQQPHRQAFYFRALRTIPELKIKLGQYQEHVRRMLISPHDHDESIRPLYDDSGKPKPYKLFNADGGQERFALVVKSEEKGSDVNLASQLLKEAYANEFDLAVVISNDSDLAEPIRIVSLELKKPVGFLCPYPKLCNELDRYGKFRKIITEEDLINSQFDDDLSDSQGPFHRPKRWE